MRLSEFEILSIRTLAFRHFGTDVQVFLFGSRTFNQQRGGENHSKSKWIKAWIINNLNRLLN